MVYAGIHGVQSSTAIAAAEAIVGHRAGGLAVIGATLARSIPNMTIAMDFPFLLEAPMSQRIVTAKVTD